MPRDTMIQAATFNVQENVPLAPCTTLGLGGPARYFASCHDDADILEGIEFARKRRVRLFLLGGGSNLVIPDEGFDGLVLRMESRGIRRANAPEGVRVTAAAGEPWDGFVQTMVAQGLAGVECLSGIPGSVGATPVQNVGAYGEEVSQTILTVSAMDLRNGEDCTFRNPDCRFGYRQSRFKGEDAGRYAVTAVTFLLQPGARPVIHYPELQKEIAAITDFDNLPGGAPALTAVREAVLTVRRRKAMVIDPADPDSRSAGSFFMNPIVPPGTAALLKARYPNMPIYPAGDGTKISAAWLVEHAGFSRGFRMGGAAISEKHALALVNRGTTTRELLTLAAKIREAVHTKFDLWLQQEPETLESNG